MPLPPDQRRRDSLPASHQKNGGSRLPHKSVKLGRHSNDSAWECLRTSDGSACPRKADGHATQKRVTGVEWHAVQAGCEEQPCSWPITCTWNVIAEQFSDLRISLMATSAHSQLTNWAASSRGQKARMPICRVVVIQRSSVPSSSVALTTYRAAIGLPTHDGSRAKTGSSRPDRAGRNVPG